MADSTTPPPSDLLTAPIPTNLLDAPDLLSTPAEPQTAPESLEVETAQQKFERLEAAANAANAAGGGEMRVSSVDAPPAAGGILADLANDEQLLAQSPSDESSMDARLPPLPKGDETPSKAEIHRRIAINVGKDMGYDIVSSQDRVKKPIQVSWPA